MHSTIKVPKALRTHIYWPIYEDELNKKVQKVKDCETLQKLFSYGLTKPHFNANDLQ